MKLSPKSTEIYSQITQPTAKLGDLKKIAREIKKDHELAMELWATGDFYPRLFATLLIDKKLLTQEVIDKLDSDTQPPDIEEQTQIIDWLMANQLSKGKKTIALMESWENNASALQRRVFWYYQARLRWMGNTDHHNTEALLTSIEINMASEQPEVQWAMNYTADQIGKWQEEFRARCIAIGEQTGLYKDEIVVRGCTPSYLPKFIPIEVTRLKK